MKKNVNMLVIILWFSSILFSQENQSDISDDLFFGGKFGLGTFYKAGTGYIIEFEKLVNKEFVNIRGISTKIGIGGSIGNGNYKSKVNGDDWKYTNQLVMINTYIHADVLKNNKIDTYLKFGIGYNAGTVKYLDSPKSYGYEPPNNAGIVTSGAIGARYYLLPKLAAAAELGWGIGILRIGIDLLI